MHRVGITIYFICVIAVSPAFISCSSGGAKLDVEQAKRIAGDLRDNKLYAAAIDDYRAILDRGGVDDTQKGNISYLIGKIYFEDLKDYGNAAAWLVRARAYDANGSYINDASMNLVTSLEKMGHHLDARRELGAATDIETKPAKAGDVEVARVGGRPIYLSEVEKHIQSLPEKAQQQFTSKEAKREFIRQYVGVELMYRAALREGFDKDPQIMDRKEQLEKSLLVQKYVTERVFPEMKLDTADVRNFYLANKDTRYENKPFDSVKAQILMDYQSQKAEAAYADYLGRLAKAEQVEFLDQNI
jgi:hypothetical protein